MSELGTAFYQFALAQMACQAAAQTHNFNGYQAALKNLEYASEHLGEAFYGAEIDFEQKTPESEETRA